MAEKKPLALYSGEIKELQAGDTLPGSGYTDEMAQDAVGAMVDGSIVYNDATPYLKLDGDQDSPGPNMVYGTDGAGNKGWISAPSGDSSSIIIELS